MKSLNADPDPAIGGREQADFLRARADQAYLQSGERFVTLLRKEIARLDNALAPGDDCEAARRLAHALAAAADAQRAGVFLSQIHMTLNRLGLRNVEEVYTARFLWRAVEQVRAEAWPGLGIVSRTPRRDRRAQIQRSAAFSSTGFCDQPCPRKIPIALSGVRD